VTALVKARLKRMQRRPGAPCRLPGQYRPRSRTVRVTPALDDLQARRSCCSGEVAVSTRGGSSSPSAVRMAFCSAVSSMRWRKTPAGPVKTPTCRSAGPRERRPRCGRCGSRRGGPTEGQASTAAHGRGCGPRGGAERGPAPAQEAGESRWRKRGPPAQAS